MADGMEKIYVTDRSDNTALLASLMNHRGSNHFAEAAALNNQNNWMNNPLN